jgi:SOS-response transcriptional repressor LexA
MTYHDDDLLDDLMRAMGAAIERQDEALVYQDERFLTWLAHGLRGGMSRAQRLRDDRDAEAFARRGALRLAIRRAERSLPRRELRYRGAPITATVSQSVQQAVDEGCAPLLDLAAAAGVGRELWDEPCETWIELPRNVPRARYVALRVAGDSMDPLLTAGDVILVKLDDAPSVDGLVVVRLPDDGFVVKRVARLSRQSLELASFNPAYASIVVQRERGAVLGTVIARFKRE